jgi:tetratricopeptide (TPR) repeat protein
LLSHLPGQKEGITTPIADFHLHPEYRQQRPLDAILSKVPAGSDEFVTERYAAQVEAVFGAWTAQLKRSPRETAALEGVMGAAFVGTSPKPISQQPVRAASSLKVWRLQFAGEESLGCDRFLDEWRAVVSGFSQLFTAEFQITCVRATPAASPSERPSRRIHTVVRFELVGASAEHYREQRIGNWELEWTLSLAGELRLERWRIIDETRAAAFTPIFADVTSHALGANPSYDSQLRYGVDYWRTLLDGACGIDVYGHNGISFADVDGDGLDDLYICQPAGLPNRLYRNRGDGTFEDITDKSGLGILENTSCALFADFDNDGRQDVIIVRLDGPVLFLNQGGGRFKARPDAFRFQNPPQGSFTGAAIADYDCDGWLDIYFCLYSYYQGADQYRYPAPYYDAENGPPNFLMLNERDGTFRDVTRESGMDVNNRRFSFCCAWGDSDGDGWPDLCVVNDFGRKNLYRNNRDGTFTDVATEADVEDVGAGMSACWLDHDNDGRQDLYIANMWTPAGLRLTDQDIFQKTSGEQARALFRKHAMGNSLYRNRDGRSFENVSARSATEIGRWSWCSDSWDFDHDGFPDLYIANGMVSGPNRNELNSFFWRQVVARSPNTAKPNSEYEQGWNAINELIRSDGTWSGYERNMFYANNGDATFSEVSGVAGLDCIEDSRSFALADFDQDGCIECVLKNRNAPQVRVLRNRMPDLPPAIAFRLRGTKSNRDAIGASVTIEAGSMRQTRLLQAGSGFLAQHAKELFFGLGENRSGVTATIQWPSGLRQTVRDLPVNHRVWIEEGSQRPRIEPFRRAASSRPNDSSAPTAAPEMLRSSVETWLLLPVEAPDFALTDTTGHTRKLSEHRGSSVLLHFWSAEQSCCNEVLAELERHHKRWVNTSLRLLTINVASNPDRARPSHNWTFPILTASADVLAIYNILFRYVYDRHRDLPIPTSFLIDSQGEIAKIYSGVVPAVRFEADHGALPLSASQRISKALPFPGVSEASSFGRNYLSLGSRFYERGYLEQAQICFLRALRDDPSSAEAFYGAGSIYLQQQKNAEARQSFERAVQLRAGYPGTMSKAWNNLGILAAREMRTEEAIRNFQRSLEFDPEYVVALVNLGNAYRQRKGWDQAKAVLQRALQIAPDDPEANYALGMVFAQRDQPEQAVEYLQKALAARPNYPEALNNLAILYIRTHRLAEAEKTFEESIRVAPLFDQSYLNLARLHAVQGETEKARAVLQSLLQQRPGHPQAEQELAKLPR